ncbi:regulator of replication initiation timing [Bradyrhizobium sp. AZCC 2262]|uniref:annexin n=1 Tax=Bradyrhizobium sp. AZCC 2262 TaxID=3117022 RepID=UPI002FF0B857
MNGSARQTLIRSSPAPPVATRHANQARISETEEDRLGARRLWQESREAGRRDAWSEMAEIIARLLSASQLAEPMPAPALAASVLPGAAAVPAEAVVPTEAPQDESVQAASAGGRSDRDAAQRTLLAATSKPTPDTLAAPGQKKPAAAGQEGIVAAPEGEPAAPALAAADRMPGMQEPTADPSEAPTAIVQRWRQGVRSAGAAVPVPRVSVSRTSSGALDKAKAAAKTKGEQTRGGLGNEATANLPATPQVDNPPPPPPSNPIPRETQAIITASGKRLANQFPPLLIPSPPREIEDKIVGGSLPRLDQRPIPPDLFNVLITPGAFALSKIDTAAKGPNGKRTPEAERAVQALDMLEGRDQLPEKQGHGPPVMFEDKGAPPMRPLPEQFRTPVKEIVARLLARTDTTTSDVLNRLRSRAYPHDALVTNFPDCGAGMTDGLRTAITTDLRDIAFAAGATAEELDGLIAARQQALAASVDAARQDAAALGKDTTAKVAAEGQKTVDAIDGAAKAADEEMLRRQEATSGSADPVVINRRRDLTVNWITEHVTNQTTAYQLAGEQRAKELREARDGQLGGYLALSQREQYEVLTPKPPRPERVPTDSARETRLTDLAAEIRAWTDTRVAEIGEAFRKIMTAASNETKAFRGAVESAGSYARERVREWAEDEVLKGESWWTRFIARIRRWLKEAEDVNETWRVRRTQAQRDGIALDLLTVSDIEAKMAAGISQEEILKDGALSDEQRTIVKLYFRKGANEGPLDIAAKGLEERMASDHLEHARTVFESELRAKPAAFKQYDIVHKLEDVARSLNPGFDAGKITQDLHSAMDRWGTDEDLIFTSLKGVTPFEGDVIRKMYRARYDLDLDDHIESEMSGDELDQAQAELAGEPSKADAIALHDAVDGIGTNENKIYETLRNKTPEEIEKIRAEYRKKYGEELDAALKDDLDEGNETDRAMALLKGDTATADAIALDEAMRGGLTGLGTDEAEIEKVLTRVRQEVMARARTENWNSAQMEAEVRRRLKAISDKFEGRYKNVSQYKGDGLTGKTTLERAFQSELSGAELDLAEALRTNDPVAADAARLEIERTGFYTSDSKVNGVLRSQYERALEKRRLDEGPARNMAIRRQIDAMREQSYTATGPNAQKLSENQISEARIRLEREADRAMEKDAAVDAGASMDALTKLYKDRYHVPVEFVVAFGMDGRDQREAFALLKNRGYLSPRQEIELATEGVGTDEDLLKKTFSRMTRAEIEVVRKEWELRHPGENFNDMIRGELSGRDESDIMDMVEHGAPESDAARIEQERRRVDREIRDLTGAFGGAAAGKEAAWMEDQVRRLEALKPDLMRTDWQNTEEDRERRERLAAEVDFRAQRVQDAVEDHRRKLDSFADDIAMAIGVIVAVVISVASLGSLTWVGAIIISLVGTALTMGAKYAIKGGSYAGADVAIDLAAGVVDAATAGLATKFGLNKALMKGVGALVSKARLKDVATLIGKSGIAQRALKTPVLGAATRAAGRLLPSAGAIEKGIVRFVAGTAEDAAMAIPSGTVGILASDETWKGDPLHNFLSGGGDTLLQAVIMGKVTHAASHVAGHVATGVRSEIRMGSETGRMREVSRLVNDHYARFHEENPGASLADFLGHAEGRTLRVEIEKRGLLPTIESANARARTEAAAPTREAGGDVREPTAKPAPEARSGELHNALPEKLREGSFVTPDESLGGRTVKVEPLMVGKDIVGVDIRVGPDATPLDVALHGATVEAMLKYRGVMGRLRRVMADLGSHLVEGGVKVGSLGWEAKLELDKLPAVLASRMNEVAGARMMPETQTHFDMDVAHLQSQIDAFEHVLRNPALAAEPGRGFVAAEFEGGVPPAKPEGVKIPTDELEGIRRMAIEAGTGNAARMDELRSVLAAMDSGKRAAVVEALAAPVPAELLGAPPSRNLLAEMAKVWRDNARIGAAYGANPRVAGEHVQLLLDLQRLRMLARDGIRTGNMSEAQKFRQELIARLPKGMASKVPEIGGPISHLEYRFEKAHDAAQAELIKAVREAPDTDMAALKNRLKEIAKTFNLEKGDLSKRIFEEMVEWIKQRGLEDARWQKHLDSLHSELRSKSTAEIHRAIESSPDPELRSIMKDKDVEAAFKASGPNDEFKAEGVIAAMEEAIRKRMGQDIRGRRPGSPHEIRDQLRGMAGGIDLEGFIMADILAENIAAAQRLRARLATIAPEVVFTVERGGPLLAEFLVPPAERQQRPDKFVSVNKSKNRTEYLRPQIEKAIANGKRSFVIVDAYMGGHAIGEFTNMFQSIIEAHPHLEGLRFETLWLREQLGYERNLVEGPDGAALAVGLQPAFKIPPELINKVFQQIEPVRFIMGDDAAVFFDPNSRRPIFIFDNDGHVVQTIEVGVKHPITGVVLTTPREILVALMQGVKFPK